MDPDYLTDKEGEPDPEVERLESLLSDARYKAPAVPRARPEWRVLLAAGIAIFVLVGGALQLSLGRDALGVVHADGSRSRLVEGKWLETNEGAAEVSLNQIGSVRVSSGSKVRLISVKQSEQRLELLRGELHATVNAPPRLFVVETPAATAVDLGCEYVLKVSDAGDGELRVLSGVVALEGRGHPVFVPQGFAALTSKATGVSVPSRAEASASFHAALKLLEGQLASEGTALELEHLATLLREAKKWDSPTLFELLQRLPQSEQRVVAGQLAALIPAPPGVVARVLQGDPNARAEWWAIIYQSYDVP